jgi:hypothetical protein
MPRVADRRKTAHVLSRAVHAAFALLLAVLPLLGCERSNIKADLNRHSRGDEDLLALLPRGLDAVFDVDVAGLGKLETAAQLASYLPDKALARLSVVADSPLKEIDGFVAGIVGADSGEAQVVWVVRAAATSAPPETDKRLQTRVFSSLRALSQSGAKPEGDASEVEYHGLPLIETGDGVAAAMLTARTVAIGDRQTVRQVIDIFRGDEEGARSQSDLMEALGRAPRGKYGRPAVMLSLLLSPPLRDRLRQIGLPELGVGADFLSGALAVGDGIDIGLCVGYRELPIAEEAGRSLQAQAAALKERPVLRFLGVEQLVQPLITVAVPKSATRKVPELHLAYRLPGGELAALLSRLAKLQELQQSLRDGKR